MILFPEVITWFLNFYSKLIFLKNGNTFINKKNKCEECECLDGSIKCYSLCQEKADSCNSYGANDTYEYTWIKPLNGSCCGYCKKTSKMFFLFK